MLAAAERADGSLGVPNAWRAEALEAAGATPDFSVRLASALGGRYVVERELGARRDGDGVPGPGPPPPASRRDQGAPSATSGCCSVPALPSGDRDGREPESPAHPAAVRLGGGGRPDLLHDAVRCR